MGLRSRFRPSDLDAINLATSRITRRVVLLPVSMDSSFSFPVVIFVCSNVCLMPFSNLVVWYVVLLAC